MSEELDALAEEIARILWDEFRCQPITHDERKRCNYFAVKHLARQLADLALRAGFEDPVHEIDWRSIIDPRLTRSEVIEAFREWLETSGKAVGRETEEWSYVEVLEREIDLLRKQLSDLRREAEEAPESRRIEINEVIKEIEEDLREKEEELREARRRIKVPKPPPPPKSRPKPPKPAPPPKPTPPPKPPAPRIPETPRSLDEEIDLKSRLEYHIRGRVPVWYIWWRPGRFIATIHLPAEALDDLREAVQDLGGRIIRETIWRTWGWVTVDFTEAPVPPPPAPPTPPKPAPREEVWKEFLDKVRALAIERGVTFSENDAKRFFDEEWRVTLQYVTDPARMSRLLSDLANTFLATYGKRRAPPPAPAPPAPPVYAPPPTPPPIPVPPVTISIENLSPGDRSYLLTYGVERFVLDRGGAYGLTSYHIPSLATRLVNEFVKRGEELKSRAETLIDWQAGDVLSRGARTFVEEGVVHGMKRFWGELIAQVKDVCWARRWRICPVNVTYLIHDPKTNKTYEYGGGRIWVEAVIARIFRLFNAPPTGDVLVAEKLLNKFYELGGPEKGPDVVRVSIDEVGGLP
jgi:hypothetical protein